MKLTLDIIGTPAPQGSKRAFVIKGKNGGNARAVVVDDNKATLRDWRQDVKATAYDAIARTGWTQADTGVQVRVIFRLKRPKGHYGSGRNAHLIKASAPAFPSTKPDVDKLARSTLDGLKEAGVYTDDSRVVSLWVLKTYADTTPPGAFIEITPLDAVAAPTLPPPSGAATVQEVLL